MAAAYLKGSLVGGDVVRSHFGSSLLSMVSKHDEAIFTAACFWILIAIRTLFMGRTICISSLILRCAAAGKAVFLDTRGGSRLHHARAVRFHYLHCRCGYVERRTWYRLRKALKTYDWIGRCADQNHTGTEQVPRIAVAVSDNHFRIHGHIGRVRAQKG